MHREATLQRQRHVPNATCNLYRNVLRLPSVARLVRPRVRLMQRPSAGRSETQGAAVAYCGSCKALATMLRCNQGQFRNVARSSQRGPVAAAGILAHRLLQTVLWGAGNTAEPKCNAKLRVLSDLGWAFEFAGIE